ncbi:response regulator transcription factor [Maribellus sp. CM-23]|uniref:response regulator transcription factor n=1 Tax=Maribellus sp. CM-23 TaxID=2781026 RepID=UPI001F3FAB4C|nr:response regulator transcription factor [Maribellus sp. CM-23]MCE4563954.1 response regulator transcription factor [Maribellus sp. CM-23]
MDKVLLIEDDPHIGELVSIHLKDLNCEVDISTDGREGYEKASTGNYSLIILDLMLPGMDGLEVCRQLRADKIRTHILMLTAKSEEIDKVLGLETGADDYLTKPFSVREFIARVKAILRRLNALSNDEEKNQSERISIDELNIDLIKRKVLLKGDRLELTPKEFDLLVLLAQKPGRVYSRTDLLNTVWGYNFNGYEHTVNSHINRLRSKIEPDINHPKYILTSWGVGYKFNDEL